MATIYKITDDYNKIYGFVDSDSTTEHIETLLTVHLDNIFDLNEAYSANVRYNKESDSYIIRGDEDYREVFVKPIETLKLY